MITELRKCPFCGSDAVVNRDRWGTYIVQCTNENCHACYRDDTHPKAVENWNRRMQ